ncbi:MAG: ArsR family transcriptional regulator [Bacteroidetes bacterium]|nr:ArsR family transcriptional regulator [Bacteroidota bacterium]
MHLEEARQKFVQSWGALGSSWGINRTMAQIHALLLVSTEPVSTEDIMEQLQVSRGNVNMNLRALIDWGIVTKENKIGERREFFVADKDIWAVARQIARERRKREIEPMLRVFDELKNTSGTDAETKEFKRMIGELTDFTSKADGVVDKFIRSDEHWFYKTLLKLVK